MPFDKTQPADSTKIRNLGVVTRPNWVAIEEADASFKPYALNLTNRSVLPAPIPADPAAIVDSYILYSKRDVAGSVQLYGINQAGTIVQISNAWGTVSAQNGYSWLAGGMLIQWGLSHANAAANTVIGFPIAFSAAPYSITTNFYRTTGSTTMKPLDIVTGSVNINNFTVWNANGGHDFFFMAIGPKV
jgi:hypothetical protein